MLLNINQNFGKFIGLFCILCLQAVSLKAQITYTGSDYADVNDSFMVSNASLLTAGSFDFELTGAGITWDYTNLVPVSQEKIKYINPNRTGFQGAYLFTCNTTCYNQCYGNCVANGGNPFICSGSCGFTCNTSCLSDWLSLFDLAEVSNDSLNLGVFTLRDIYNFYNQTNDGLYQVAIGARVSGFPSMVLYENYDRVYKFPFTYGSSDVSVSNYALQVDSIPGTGIVIALGYRHGQRRTNEVEGWGTLKTPYGEFDALKMKTTIKTSDTVVAFNDTFTLAEFLPSQITPDSIIEYKWFSKDFGIPVLKVTAWVVGGTKIYQTLQYIDSLRCFDPFAVFGYLPLPAMITTYGDSVEVNFYDFTYNANELYWNFNDPNSQDNFATGESPSHWFTEAGVYDVELVTCNTVCPNFICDTFTLPVLILDFTSPPDTSTYIISNVENDFLEIFPNPANDKLHIRAVLPGERDLEIAIMDNTGKEHKNTAFKAIGGNTLTLDISRLPAGLHFIRVKTGDEFLFRKIVKSN